jgi:hypothetical protein
MLNPNLYSSHSPLHITFVLYFFILMHVFSFILPHREHLQSSNSLIMLLISKHQLLAMSLLPCLPICNMSCICRDNHLLHWYIDMYCSCMLYTAELEELKLAGGQHNTIAYHTHTLYHHYITPTLNISIAISFISLGPTQQKTHRPYCWRLCLETAVYPAVA